MRRVDFLKRLGLGLAVALTAGVLCAAAAGQGDKAAAPKPGEPAGQPQPGAAKDAPGKDATGGPGYSGMYTFLKEGEFVQLTVEDDGSVTGLISRFGDEGSDKGAFLDQFFKSAKLEGNKLSFTTDVVHGVSFDFKGTIERGEGKNPGDEGYFVLQGTLVENISDANKKVTSRSQGVVFKMFPAEASSEQ